TPGAESRELIGRRRNSQRASGLPSRFEAAQPFRFRFGLCRAACSTVRQLALRELAGAEFARQLVAAADVELLEDMSEMGLDGGWGDEQPLSDLPVGETFSRQIGDASLRARQSGRTREGGAPRPGARRQQLRTH